MIKFNHFLSLSFVIGLKPSIKSMFTRITITQSILNGGFKHETF